MDAARDFLQSTFGDKHPYVWALHDPVAADGGRQPHVHVLWSARMLDGIARTPAQFFRRYNATILRVVAHKRRKPFGTSAR